eukprot:scaffold138442_cov109-Phaeocystis_antarctica.AAC.1
MLLEGAVEREPERACTWLSLPPRVSSTSGPGSSLFARCEGLSAGAAAAPGRRPCTGSCTPSWHAARQPTRAALVSLTVRTARWSERQSALSLAGEYWASVPPAHPPIDQ